MSTDETSKLSIEEQSLLAQAQALEVEAAALELKLRDQLIAGETCRQFPLTGRLGGEMTIGLIASLVHWQRADRENHRDVQISLNSAGEADELGESFVDTFAMFDAIRWARAAGQKVKIQVTGMAARQAAVLLQAADERVMTPNSHLMLTEATFGGFRGTSANARDQVDFRKDLEKQARQLLIERSGGKLTLEQLTENTDRQRQWWLTAQEALQVGLIDRIATELQSAPELPSVEVQVEDGDSALVRKQKAELRLNLLKAHAARLEMDGLGADALNPKVCCFFGPVIPQSVAIVGKMLQSAARVKGASIEMIINSPGGSVQDGLALMDIIEAIKASGVSVTTVALGQAASMGGFILQSGTRRVMGQNARILIHRISRTFGGGSSELEDQEEQMRRLETQALPLLASRSKLTLDDIRKRSEHRDWWLTASEALELGLVDEVR